MKQVISTYGKFLVDAVVLVALLFLIFTGIRDGDGNQGIFEMTGAQLQSTGIDYKGYHDFDTYKTECDRAAPEIFYSGDAMKVGLNRLSDYVKAVDSSGKDLPIRVLGIESPERDEIIDAYNPNTTEINMEQPGIYEVRISASDDANKSSVCKLRIPVNQ